MNFDQVKIENNLILFMNYRLEDTNTLKRFAYKVEEVVSPMQRWEFS